MATGTNKERVSYDELLVTQWVAGFCRSMREEQNLQMRDYKLDYLVSLVDDSHDFSWAVEKANHTVLLSRISPRAR